METTERIVEAYVRYVKGWATIPNVRCAGQNEIDLIAIDPVSLARYHIEVSISVSQSFRKLTAKPFDLKKSRERVHQAGQRRTIGFFKEKKFGSETVIEKLREFGFEPGNYIRVIVTWGWDGAAKDEAKAAGIELWDFRDMIREIAETIRGSRQYFADDTLRTLNLFIHADDEARRAKSITEAPSQEPQAPEQNELARWPEDKAKRKFTKSIIEPPSPKTEAPEEYTFKKFWVYENWTHKYAAIHRAECSFCNDGRGVHADSSSANGQWLGPFESASEAMTAAEKTGRPDVRRCGICSPATTD